MKSVRATEDVVVGNENSSYLAKKGDYIVTKDGVETVYTPAEFKKKFKKSSKDSGK